MALFEKDLDHLGKIEAYGGWCGECEVVDASGAITKLRRIAVEARFCDAGGKPWSDWMPELAIIRPNQPGAPRLSGSLMRKQYAFACPVGNAFLAVSKTNEGLTEALKP